MLPSADEATDETPPTGRRWAIMALLPKKMSDFWKDKLRFSASGLSPFDFNLEINILIIYSYRIT